jgi:hypothetical protein
VIVIGQRKVMCNYSIAHLDIMFNTLFFRYYSVTKVLMGFAASCSLVLIYFVGYDTLEPILKRQLPENRFYLMSLVFRILVLTLSGKI